MSAQTEALDLTPMEVASSDLMEASYLMVSAGTHRGRYPSC
jgi:hypothetical protein